MSVPTIPGAELWLAAFLGDAGVGPDPLHIALLTGDPREAGVEVTGDGYDRVTVANTDAAWDDTTPGERSAQVMFPAATGAWDVARWWAAADGASSTDWCLAGPLSETVALLDGDAGLLIVCVARIDRVF